MLGLLFFFLGCTGSFCFYIALADSRRRLELAQNPTLLKLSASTQNVENVCSSCQETQAHAFADSDRLCDGCMINGAKPKPRPKPKPKPMCESCGGRKAVREGLCETCRDWGQRASGSFSCAGETHCRSYARVRRDCQAHDDALQARLFEAQYGYAPADRTPAPYHEYDTLGQCHVCGTDRQLVSPTLCAFCLPASPKRKARICASCGTWDCTEHPAVAAGYVPNRALTEEPEPPMLSPCEIES